eukprot:g65632.t1
MITAVDKNLDPLFSIKFGDNFGDSCITFPRPKNQRTFLCKINQDGPGRLKNRAKNNIPVTFPIPSTKWRCQNGDKTVTLDQSSTLPLFVIDIHTHLSPTASLHSLDSCFVIR